MSSLTPALYSLLAALRTGNVADADRGVERPSGPTSDLGFARPDAYRELRQGAPEAILAQGKSPDEVAAIVAEMLASTAGSVMVTRADEATRAAIRARFPEALEHSRAAAVWIPRGVPQAMGQVAMISAGTSDGCVLHEARIRAELLGTSVVVHEDLGVAGLHRLIEVLSDLREADCVVVCAGMDGALVSVVGGLVPCPVIGVPTSAGYGSANNGRTALNAMLSSCAAGVAVVGIDDGFGAGTVAALIARVAARRE